MYNKTLMKIFIDIQFFPTKMQFYIFGPQNFALSSTLLKLLQSQSFELELTKNNVRNKNSHYLVIKNNKNRVVQDF